MDSNLANCLLKICEVFNKHDLKCMIVGGTAVALHGYFRHSMNISGEIADKPDIDFWFNPTYENYFNLLNALSDLGQDVQKFREEQAPNPKKSFFKYVFEDFTLDLLPQIKAPIKFRDSYKNREVVNIKGIDISFINLEDLLKDKEATSRPKDLNDVEQLKELNKDGTQF
jgi:hypothetical protein